MILIKAVDGEIIKFPYTLNELRAENPNISFPTQFSDELFNQFGVYRVVYQPTPVYDKRTQYLDIAQTPILLNGVWTMTRTVIDKTAEEIANTDEEERKALRKELSDQIDTRTSYLITHGFLYKNEHHVRMTAEDQNNYEGQYDLIRDFIDNGVPEVNFFPTTFKIWTEEETGAPIYYHMNNLSEMRDLIIGGKLFIRYCLEAGWDLKTQLTNMTLNELKAWSDPR